MRDEAIGFACWCIYCGNASQGLRIDYNDVLVQGQLVRDFD